MLVDDCRSAAARLCWGASGRGRTALDERAGSAIAQPLRRHNHGGPPRGAAFAGTASKRLRHGFSSQCVWLRVGRARCLRIIVCCFGAGPNLPPSMQLQHLALGALRRLQRVAADGQWPMRRLVRPAPPRGSPGGLLPECQRAPTRSDNKFRFRSLFNYNDGCV
jgi:hypothetical protein